MKYYHLVYARKEKGPGIVFNIDVRAKDEEEAWKFLEKRFSHIKIERIFAQETVVEEI